LILIQFTHRSEEEALHYYADIRAVLWLQQTYLQSLSVRLEEMRIKRRDSEQWMHHRLLPHDLRERVRKYDQYKWFETRGVDEENLVQNLPKDLRRDIKRHLCLNLVRRVSIVLFFSVIIDAPLVCFFPIFLWKYVFGHGGYAGPSICQYG